MFIKSSLAINHASWLKITDVSGTIRSHQGQTLMMMMIMMMMMTTTEAVPEMSVLFNQPT
jgi:hypothetical protein